MSAKKRKAKKAEAPYKALYRAAHSYVKRHGGLPVVEGGICIIENLPGQKEGEYVLGIRFWGGPVPRFAQ